MNLREWAATKRANLQLMADNRQRDGLTLALDLLGLIQLRIQTQGRNSAGAAFVPYSPAYAAKRKSRGRQTSIVDFTDTGAMWRNTTGRVIDHGLLSTTIEIGAQDSLSREKLAAPLTVPKGRPRGFLLRPSADEVQIVQDANLQRVIKYITL